MADAVIFDMDRTITRQPTWTRFLIFANRARPVFWLFLLRILAQGAAYKLGFASRDSVKVVSLRALSHLSRSQLETIAADFIAREVKTGLRPGAVAAIRWHVARGDRLIIASASVDLYVDLLARALGFQEVIATRLDWSENGSVPPPRLLGKNCYGDAKMERIADHGLSRFQYAYSDHVSDLDMLLMAENGIAVNPSSGLRQAAQKRGLRIVDFESTEIGFLSEGATETA